MSLTTARTGSHRPAPLTPEHRVLLEQASGISPEVIAARGYHTCTSNAELHRLGFGRGQCSTPALVIPVYDPDGGVALYQARPDRPRVGRDGRVAKYEVPRGCRLAIDVPPPVRSKVLDAGEPLVVALGVRSADAAASRGCAAVGLLHPYGWMHQDAFWRRVPLPGRAVRVVWGATDRDGPESWRAAEGLRQFLRACGADVQLVTVPTAPDGRLRGLDDWLASGNALDGLPRSDPPSELTPAAEPAAAQGHRPRVRGHPGVREPGGDGDQEGLPVRRGEDRRPVDRQRDRDAMSSRAGSSRDRTRYPAPLATGSRARTRSPSQ